MSSCPLHAVLACCSLRNELLAVCLQVISVGPGAVNRDGKLIPVNVKVGDKVLLPEYGGHSIKDDKDQELTLLRDEDILAIIQE